MGTDTSPDRGTDLPVADRGSDGRTHDGSVCGGSRKLVPTPLAKGTPTPCGTACKEVFGAPTLDNRFELEGDLVLFSVRPDIYKAQTVGFLRLSTGQAWQIRPQALVISDFCKVPVSDGTRIAYHCRRSNGDSASRRELVALFDPATGTERDLTCVPKKTTTFCAVLDLGFTNGGVAMNYPPGTGCGYQAALQPQAGMLQDLPSNSDIVFLHGAGDIVVWSEGNPKQGWALNAVAYHLVNKTKTFVDPSPRDQILTRTDGRYIVWADSRHDPKSYYRNWANTEIYRHDLQTGTTERVTNQPAQQVYPDVSGKWVVWEDSRNDPVSITPGLGQKKRIDAYAKNMETGQEYYLTSGQPQPYLIQRPRVDAGRLLYEATDGGQRGVLNLVDLEAFAKAQR